MPALLPSRSTFTGRGPGDLGSLTHVLVGSHVQFVCDHDAIDRESSHDLLARMYAVASALIDATPNATRVLATEAASLAFRYLSDLRPAQPWMLLGVEHDTGAGFVDVAWVHAATRQVMFDELKTSRVSKGRQVPPRWIAQARRYAGAGTLRHGDGFLGVRLLPLMPHGVARLVREGEPLHTLNPTVAEPLRTVSAMGGDR